MTVSMSNGLGSLERSSVIFSFIMSSVDIPPWEVVLGSSESTVEQIRFVSRIALLISALE